MDRLLVFSGIGAFGVLALLADAEGLWRRRGEVAASWQRRGVLVLLVLHVPLAAPLLLARTAALPMFGEMFSVGATDGPRGPEVTDQTFVFVNGNDFPIIYTRMLRILDGSPSPRRVVQLASMTTPSTVYREDEHTLVITPRDGFLAYALDQLLASPTRTFQAGERIERPDYAVEIRSTTTDGRPRQAAFHFVEILEHQTLRWLYWKGGELLEFPLPLVGQEVTVRDSYPTR